VRVDHRLGVQARRELLRGGSRRLPGSGFNRLAEQGIVGLVLAVAANAVVAVGTAGQHLASGGEPAEVYRVFRVPGPLGLGFDPAIGKELGIERVADLTRDVLDLAVADVGSHVVGRVVPPVLGHRWLDRMLNPG
jgi:hypothetical protein